ncbi:MAG: cysteine hydrolase [Lachnospiraceae bacterium]|nr:cysteine hydrolase [Lachnospiraceae bacterium]MBQ8632902.1 cysteine hydrolase [Lachnospiraceae bacterium]
MKYLIVVDMQNDFITGSLGTKEAEAILPKVIEKIKNFEGTILYTKDTHQADYMATQEGKNLPVEHCIEGSWGWMLADELEKLSAGHKVFNKPTFGSVELAKYLVEENAKDEIEEIELCGLCTDICVISNTFVIKANLTEVPVTVDASCCAGVTPESHLNALAAMKMCQVKVYNE